MKIRQTTIFAIILGILILVSAVQAVQLNGLKNTLSEGNFNKVSSKSASTSTSVGSGSGGNQLTNVQNLPQMVGGC